MTRTVVFGLAALLLALFSRNAIDTAQAGEASPEQWQEFAADLADLQASLAQAEASLTDGPNSWRWRECRFQSLQHGLWTPREERLTADCAVQKWSVSGGLSKFLQVGSCESGWNRWANNAGRYLGLFQHAASAYVSRVHQYEPQAWDRDLSTWWANSRGQIVMTARMVHAGGWGPWSCA